MCDSPQGQTSLSFVFNLLAMSKLNEKQQEYRALNVCARFLLM